MWLSFTPVSDSILTNMWCMCTSKGERGGGQIIIIVHAFCVLLIHALCLLDKTAPNVAFEYGGDRNGDDNLKEIEVEEKQQLFDSTITAPLTRSNNFFWQIL